MSKYDVKVNISTSILVCFKKKYYLCCLKSFGKTHRIAKKSFEKIHGVAKKSFGKIHKMTKKSFGKIF